MGITVTGIIILLVLVFFLIYGIKMGLIKSVVDLLAFFLTWLLTWLLYPMFAKFLITTPLYIGIKDWITLTLNNNEFLNGSMPEFLVSLPAFLKDSIIISSEQTFEVITSSIADGLSVLTINLLSIIILFIGIRIIMLLFKKIGIKINKIFVIGPINMILGGAFGFVQGLCLVYLVIAVISYFPTTSVYKVVSDDMQRSFVCQKMFNENTKFMGIPLKYPEVRGE